MRAIWKMIMSRIGFNLKRNLYSDVNRFIYPRKSNIGYTAALKTQTFMMTRTEFCRLLPGGSRVPHSGMAPSGNSALKNLDAR